MRQIGFGDCGSLQKLPRIADCLNAQFKEAVRDPDAVGGFVDAAGFGAELAAGEEQRLAEHSLAVLGEISITGGVHLFCLVVCADIFVDCVAELGR